MEFGSFLYDGIYLVGRNGALKLSLFAFGSFWISGASWNMLL